MELISIIVPIYNAQSYLDKCIESILNQTYKNLEIILVDDGSVDDSLKKCMGYAGRDKRIKVIHTENKGRVSARKTGLQNATGKIIAFVDSDDWLEPIMYEKLYGEIRRCDADIVISGYFENCEKFEKLVFNKLPQGVYGKKELEQVFYPHMLCYASFFQLGIQPYLWNKLFRREIIEKFILETDERLIIGEDVACIFPAFLLANRISILREGYYHYYLHTASTMHHYLEVQQETRNIVLLYTCMKKAFEKSNQNKEWGLETQLQNYILHMFLIRNLSYVYQIVSGKKYSLFSENIESKDIIVYSAGAFGMSLYYFLMEQGICTIAGWCDRDYAKFEEMKYPVIAPKEAVKKKFDFIIVAVLNDDIARDIKKNLMALGVKESKILCLNTDKLLSKEVLDKILM